MKTQMHKLKKIVAHHIQTLDQKSEKKNPKYEQLKKDKKALMRTMESEIKKFRDSLAKKHKVPTKYVMKGTYHLGEALECLIDNGFFDVNDEQYYLTDKKVVEEIKAVETGWQDLCTKAEITITKEGKQELEKSLLSFFSKHKIKVL